MVRLLRSGAAFVGLASITFLSWGCPSKPVKLTPKSMASPAAAAAPIQFTDVSQEAGVRFTHFNGADGRFYMPESFGSGGAFLDYDGDGWLDLFLINCSNWPDRPAAGKTSRLFRNRGDHTFEDVTKQAGLAVPMFGLGCAVGDYDNDGHDDLLVTCMSGKRLFHNTGRAFEDVTEQSGLGRSGPWDYHTGAAWFDYDRDGQLDLFVCRYVLWSPTKDVPCRSGLGKRIYCGPNEYDPLRSQLYRNLGGGRFEDVSQQTGIAAAKGKALGVLPLDENGDGWIDLLVTNDTTPNHLFRNQQGKRFVEVAQEAGIAVDENGRPRAGMGVDLADVRNDGGLEISIGNFTKEGMSLYDRSGTIFMDSGPSSGLVPASLHNVTFGVTFLDADRDGWQDLVGYNGHVDPHADEAGGSTAYRQRPQFFRNVSGSFTEIGSSVGEAFRIPQVGRGCAWGDFDNDGRPDLALFENSGPARLLRNTSTDSHHWLGIHLQGTRGNRNAYGSEVRVTAGGVTQRRWVHSGGSYLSQSDTRALFGIGPATAIEQVEVLWPSGKRSVQKDVVVDRYLSLTEPDS